MATTGLRNRHGVSSATFYKWRAKFGRFEVPEAQRLRQLESESAKLKRLLAEAMLVNAMLREIAAKRR
jgi:putative transposase